MRGRLPALALCLVLLFNAAALMWYVDSDRRVGAFVCCSLVHEVSQALRHSYATGADPTLLPWAADQGWVGPLAAMARRLLGPNPDFTLALTGAALLLSQLLLFLVGRELRAPWAGVVAAAGFGLLPVVAFMARRWDTYALQWPWVLLVTWLVVSGRGRRGGWTPLLALAVTAGATLSPRRTDNLLFVLPLLGMALGQLLEACLVELRTQRGPGTVAVRLWLDSPSVRRAALAALAVGVGAGAALLLSGGGFSQGGWVYYLREAANSNYAPGEGTPWGANLLAYGAHLFNRGLTPPVAVAVCLAALAHLRRGQARGALWGALLFAAALSVIGKKNYYYLAPVYPVLALVAGLGALAVRRAELRWGGMGLVFTYLLVMGVARSQPERFEGTRLAQVRWLRGDATAGGALQTQDFELNIAPLPEAVELPLLELVGAGAGGSCACPLLVGWASERSAAALQLGLSEVDPCLVLVPWRERRFDAQLGAWLVEEPAQWQPPAPLDGSPRQLPGPAPWAQRAAQALAPPFELRGQTLMRGRRFWLSERVPARSCGL